MTLEERLDVLAELKAQLNLEQMNLEAQIQAIMEPVRGALIAAEWSAKPRLVELTDAICANEEAIKRDVMIYGASVNGAHLQAVYSKGRVSWNTKGLDGYAVAHPEINVFRSVGQPSVSIRKGGDA